jgi:hypothetical protein
MLSIPIEIIHLGFRQIAPTIANKLNGKIEALVGFTLFFIIP